MFSCYLIIPLHYITKGDIALFSHLITSGINYWAYCRVLYLSNFLWSLLFWCIDVSKVFDNHIWCIIAATVCLLVDIHFLLPNIVILLSASAPKIDRLGFIVDFISDRIKQIPVLIISRMLNINWVTAKTSKMNCNSWPVVIWGKDFCGFLCPLLHYAVICCQWDHY